MTAPALTVGTLELGRRGPDRAGPVGWLLPAGLALSAAALLGLLVGRLAAGGQPVLALLCPLVLLPLALWRRPRLGLYLLFAGTILVEQFGYQVGPRDGAVTARIPLFHSIVSGTGITPAEVLTGLVLLVWVLQSVRSRTALLHRSRLAGHLGLLCALVLVFLVVGVARGGDLSLALWEARPFLYLTAVFLLASTQLTSTSSVRVLLWTMVLGSGVKAVYGIHIWLSIRSLPDRPEAVLAHEESFFFGLFILLTLGLWLFRVPGRLRVVATCLAPVVLFADMCNSRRTAWAILLVGGALMFVVAYVRLRDRRRVLRRLGLLALVVSAVYLPAFWNHDGATAQPARAVRSVVAPDLRDEQSNQYRYVESANLSLNIQEHHSTGMGYGIPIAYRIAMVDLRSVDRFIAYVPHNGILYVWMRLGVLGEIVLWLVVAHALVAACRLSSAVDPETALLGALVACAVAAYVIMGEKDMGFMWFRMAFCMGALLGAVQARSRVLGIDSPADPATGAGAG